MNTAILRLMVGFKRFKEKYFQANDLDISLYSRLASTGQTPKTLFIGCSDSRVDPAILTSSAPGDLFVIRNVANLVPPCEHSTEGVRGTSSAIEFAVMNLKVENILILGHRQCGGIRALMSNKPMESSFIGQWMNVAAEARIEVLKQHPHGDEDTLCRAAEMESIKVSMKNLMTFPFVREAVEAKKLNIVGLYFDLERGELWQYDEVSKIFKPLEI
ncbi:MAG: carbonic anhydrase [Moraxellaceae bacterium]|nr:carbonic anhydrase [Pseudobdellovibrionaceae bacterium]